MVKNSRDCNFISTDKLMLCSFELMAYICISLYYPQRKRGGLVYDNLLGNCLFIL